MGRWTILALQRREVAMDAEGDRMTGLRCAPAPGSAPGIEWPDSPGKWTRHGEEWTAKRTADGEMWIIPPCPEDGCVPRMLATLADPPVLGGWVKVAKQAVKGDLIGR